MTDSNVKKWYVVRAVSGQENKVKAYIETEISRLGMGDYISQVLVPTEKVVQMREGKKIVKDRVYFPGYVMVEANLTGEIPHIIKSITGVIGFLGEVKNPTVIPVANERISLLEALGLAGDLTIYAKRDNVLLIRDENGERTTQRIDLNSTDLFTSPYYYLQSNDIIYVEPVKKRAENLTRIIGYTTAGLSLLIFLLDRVFKAR